MAVNKVSFNTANGEEVLIDLTGDNATADVVFEGATFHGADGEKKAGTFTISSELTEQEALIEQIKAAVDNLPEAGGGTIKTATVTLSGIFPTYSVCYMSPSGAQRTTHSASPFTCVVPSIMYLEDGNATNNLSGSISRLYKTNSSLILNITGDGEIVLTQYGGGAD